MQSSSRSKIRDMLLCECRQVGFPVGGGTYFMYGEEKADQLLLTLHYPDGSHARLYSAHDLGSTIRIPSSLASKEECVKWLYDVLENCHFDVEHVRRGDFVPAEKVLLPVPILFGSKQMMKVPIL